MIHFIITLLLLAAIGVLLYFTLRKKNSTEQYKIGANESNEIICIEQKYTDLLDQLYNASAGELVTQLKADKINAANINTAVAYTSNPPVAWSEGEAAVQLYDTLFFNIADTKWKIKSSKNLEFIVDNTVRATIGNQSGNFVNYGGKNCC